MCVCVCVSTGEPGPRAGLRLSGAACARGPFRSGSAAGAALRFSSVPPIYSASLRRSPLLLLGSPASFTQAFCYFFFFSSSSKICLPLLPLFGGVVVQYSLILLNYSSP